MEGMEYFAASNHPLEDKWYSLAEVAGILRVSPQTVWRTVLQGRLVAVNVGAGVKPLYRVRGKEILRFLNEGMVKINQRSQRPARPSPVPPSGQPHPPARRKRTVYDDPGKRRG